MRKKLTPASGAEPDGLLIAVCEGHRCNALHRLADAQNGADRLQPAITSSRGAVLVSAQCLGACASGAVAAVARRHGATGLTGPSLWLGGIDQPSVLDALLGWITSDGTNSSADARETLPPALHNTVIGVGNPIRTHSHN